MSRPHKNRFPLPATLLPEEYISFCMRLPKEPTHLAAFWGMIENLSWQTTWGIPLSGDSATVAYFWRSLIEENRTRFEAGEGCRDADENCTLYLPDSEFIEWFPNNPFTEPDLITEGYNAPAWYQATDLSNIALGTQTGDIVTDISRFPPGSLPSIIPASGLPRFRINLTQPSLVRMHLINIIAGSIAQITIDDNPLTVIFEDCNKDVFGAPPETDTESIVELDVRGAGEHHIDVIIVSQVNDEIPFLFHGGGLREVEICERGAPMAYFELRQNPDDDCLIEQRHSPSGEWETAFRMDNCCNDEPLVRFTETDDMEVSHDGGLTWVPATAAEDPRLRAPISPPIPGDDGDEKRCNAAQAAVNRLMAAQAEFAVELDSSPGIDAIQLFILTLVGLFLGIVAVGLLIFAPLILGLLIALVGTSPTAFNAAFTSDVWDRLLCNFMCNMSEDGSFTDSQWHAVLNQLAAEETGLAYNWLAAILKTLGANGLTNMARSEPTLTGADCSGCGCGDDCGITIGVGTLISHDGGYYVIESEPDSGFPGVVNVTVENADPCFECAFFVSFEITGSGFVAGSYIDCEDGFHETAPLTNSCFKAASWIRDEGDTPFQITIRLTPC